MKHIYFFLTLVTSSIAIEDYYDYDSEYDDDDDVIDYREIVFEVMNEPDHLQAALRCALGAGYCSETGRLVKHLLTSALYDECADCSDDKEQAVQDLILHLIQEEPLGWRAVADMYDVTGAMAAKYEDILDFHYR